MARTFVGVELEHAADEKAFSLAMVDRGFVRTVTGKQKRLSLRLPDGLYLIERVGPVEALELTREAARQSNVRARIFCLPVDGDIRFANLKAASASARRRDSTTTTRSRSRRGETPRRRS